MVLNTIDQFFVILEEQSLFKFTGILRILDRSSGDLHGQVLIEDGQVLQAYFQNSKNYKAVLKLCCNLQEGLEFDYDLVSKELNYFGELIGLSNNELRKRFQNYWEKGDLFREKRINDNSQLKISDQLMKEEYAINHHEFLILCEMLRCKSIEDVYRKSSLLEYEVTKAILDLKSKNLIQINT